MLDDAVIEETGSASASDDDDAAHASPSGCGDGMVGAVCRADNFVVRETDDDDDDDDDDASPARSCARALAFGASPHSPESSDHRLTQSNPCRNDPGDTAAVARSRVFLRACSALIVARFGARGRPELVSIRARSPRSTDDADDAGLGGGGGDAARSIDARS